MCVEGKAVSYRWADPVLLSYGGLTRPPVLWPVGTEPSASVTEGGGAVSQAALELAYKMRPSHCLPSRPFLTSLPGELLPSSPSMSDWTQVRDPSGAVRPGLLA